MSAPRVGKTLIVTEKMPCKRESNGRHATIPEGQRITILDRVQGSENGVRFSAGARRHAGNIHGFPGHVRAVLRIVKPTVPKAE
jgi:hypothetical protein